MIDPVPENGVLLYDDSCGICRHWVLRWSRTLRRNGFEVAPLQSDWVPEKLNIHSGALTEDVRLLLPDGRQVRGADVYRYAMHRIWWAYPVYLLSVTPLLHLLFNGAYRAFADHRHRVSRICGIAPPR